MIDIYYKQGDIFKIGLQTADAMCVSGSGMSFSLGLNNVKLENELSPYELIIVEKNKYFYSVPEKHLDEDSYKKHILDFLFKANKLNLKKIILNASKDIKPQETPAEWSWRELDDKRSKFMVSTVKEWIEKNNNSLLQITFISMDDSFTRVFPKEKEIYNS